jgi:SPP1 family predicted phage head-tail adaptor
MTSGTLRHSIYIEAGTETQNEYGEPVTEWHPVLATWARLEDLSGREYFSAKQVASDVTTRFRTRYFAGITSKHRLFLNGQQYDIESVQDPDGRRRELIIMAVRKG